MGFTVHVPYNTAGTYNSWYRLDMLSNTNKKLGEKVAHYKNQQNIPALNTVRYNENTFTDMSISPLEEKFTWTLQRWLTTSSVLLSSIVCKSRNTTISINAIEIGGEGGNLLSVVRTSEQAFIMEKLLS